MHVLAQQPTSLSTRAAMAVQIQLRASLLTAAPLAVLPLAARVVPLSPAVLVPLAIASVRPPVVRAQVQHQQPQ